MFIYTQHVGIYMKVYMKHHQFYLVVLFWFVKNVTSLLKLLKCVEQLMSVTL